MYTTLKKEELKKTVLSLLIANGETPENAEIIYNILLEDELTSKSSHGFYRVPMIVNSLRSGIGNNNIEMNENGSLLQVNGNDNIGLVTLTKTCDKIIEMSKTQNIVMAGVHGYKSTTGAIGYFARYLAKHGLISIITVSSEACVVPYGGAENILGTNPVAFGFPCGDNPVVTDVSTSAMPTGRIAILAKGGQPVPEGVILDKDGNPSTDPLDMLERGGMQLPLAGHKGYSLALALEILGGLFVNAKSGKNSVPGSPGTIIIAFKSDSFVDQVTYEKNINALLDEIKTTKKAPGITEIRIPGQYDNSYYKKAASDTITILTQVYKDILALAE